MTSDDERMNSPKSVWKEQPMTVRTLDHDDIMARAGRLDVQVQRRNFLEYVAGGAGAALTSVFGVQTLFSAAGAAAVVQGIGFMLLAAGILFAIGQLYRRSGQRGLPDPAQDSASFLRARLVRERDMLAAAWQWYIAPMVPGFALIYGAGIAMPGTSLVAHGVAGGLTAVFLIFVFWLNRRAARRIDGEIAALDKGERT